MSTETLRRYAYIGVLIALGGVGVWLVFGHLAAALLPFVLGWGISLVTRPVARFIARASKMPYKPAAVIVLAVTVILFGYGAAVAVGKAGGEVARFATSLVTDLDNEDNILHRGADFIKGIGEKLPFIGEDGTGDGFVDGAYEVVEGALASLATKVASAATDFAGNIVAALPKAAFALVTGILAGFYLTLDSGGIRDAVAPLLPESAMGVIARVKETVVGTVGGFVKAALAMALITFALLAVGFVILRIDYAILVAALVSFVDFLPVFGVGTVLIPWSVLCFIGGDVRLGIGLLVVYGITYAVRQFTEPYFVGGYMGIHPLFALLSAYVGFRLFGLWGMILAPMVAGGAVATFLKKRGCPRGHGSAKSI